MQNNPIRYSDPSGHKICEDIDGQCLSEKQASKKWALDHTPEPKPTKKPNIDLILETGLGSNSCVDSSCSMPPPCVNSYTAYFACDNHDPKQTRSADYVTLNIGASIPGVGTLVSGQLAVTIDRFGNLYIGPGLSLGPEAPLGFSASLSAGWVDNIKNAGPGKGMQGPLGEQETENLFSGGYVNGSICIVFCGGASGSPGNPNIGVELLGIGVPQASVGGGYSFLIDLNSNTGEPLWAP